MGTAAVPTGLSLNLCLCLCLCLSLCLCLCLSLSVSVSLLLCPVSCLPPVPKVGRLFVREAARCHQFPTFIKKSNTVAETSPDSLKRGNRDRVARNFQRLLGIWCKMQEFGSMTKPACHCHFCNSCSVCSTHTHTPQNLVSASGTPLQTAFATAARVGKKSAELRQNVCRRRSLSSKVSIRPPALLVLDDGARFSSSARKQSSRPMVVQYSTGALLLKECVTEIGSVSTSARLLVVCCGCM